MSEAALAPEVAERRKDINTRKVIEVAGKQTDEKLRHYVSWQAFSLSLVGFLGLVGVLVTALVNPAKEKATAVEVRQDKFEATTARQFELLVDKIGRLEVSAAEQRATYRVIVEGVSPREAKAEVPHR